MNNYQKQIEELLVRTLEQNASDLHLTVGRPPTLRIDGELIPLEKRKILAPEDTEAMAYFLLSPEQKEKFLQEKEFDFSYDFQGKARFRVNIFFQQGFTAIALRLILTKIKTIEELNLPFAIREFIRAKQGFVLIVGPSGHGKSTTLAALIDEINHTRRENIITIEDPIEYVFSQDLALIAQREIFRDTLSFAKALRSALREDPDVIMVGEMRDSETVSTAITAAETGHLVFATLHTNNASQTIDRIIDNFPAHQQIQIRSQLAASLLGVVSQRLVPMIEGGRTPACELLIANAAVRNLIREGKTHEIPLVIETSMEEGMISLNRSLADLVRNRKISMENALIYSLDSNELRSLVGR